MKAAIREVEKLKRKGLNPSQIFDYLDIHTCTEPEWQDVINLFLRKNLNGFFFDDGGNNL